MGTSFRRVAAVLALALFAGLAEGQSQPHEGTPAGGGRAGRGTGGATILGYLWTAESAPVPDAELRLRDVTTGRLRGNATSDGQGEFAFTDVEPGSYVVEYADANGRVVAVGSPFTIAPGETVVTFVRLGSRDPLIAGFFRSVAAAAVSAAASVGVTAIGTTGRPVSPNQ